jgi:hypothetical protein
MAPFSWSHIEPRHPHCFQALDQVFSAETLCSIDAWMVVIPLAFPSLGLDQRPYMGWTSRNFPLQSFAFPSIKVRWDHRCLTFPLRHWSRHGASSSPPHDRRQKRNRRRNWWRDTRNTGIFVPINSKGPSSSVGERLRRRCWLAATSLILAPPLVTGQPLPPVFFIVPTISPALLILLCILDFQCNLPPSITRSPVLYYASV